MFITKTSLSRRAVLRGMGATLALPFLDAMVPAATALAQTAAQPGAALRRRLHPDGRAARLLDAEDHRRRLRVLADSEAARVVPRLARGGVRTSIGRAGGTHAVSTATWLTGSSPKRTEAEDFLAGISLDQIIAGQIGRDTVFPSLEIATEDQAGYIGACDVGYSCAYMSTIAWKGPTTPLPMEINPRVVFERMFGRPGSVADRVARMRGDQSILDSVRQRRRVARARSRRPRSRAAHRVSRSRPRDRAAHRARRAPGVERHRRFPKRRSASRRRSRSTSTCCSS